MTTTDAVSPPIQWRNLIAACAAISVFGFALGEMFPLLSLILEKRGYSDGVIGLNAAMSPIGILISAPFIPAMARRFGTQRVALSAAFVTALIVLAYAVIESIELWFVLRLVQGMSVSTLFVLSEAWIVKFSDGPYRGRFVGAYASILSASFAAGPALISSIGIEGNLPFLIGAGVLIIAMLPMSMVREPPVEDHGAAGRPSSFSFARKAPMLLAAVFTFAVFDAATLSLIPVYGVRLGLDVSTAAMALTALVAGNIVLQMPIGWLADRWPKRAVMAGCAAVTGLFLLALPVTMGTVWMWPALLILGATGYGLYTVALSSLGERFQGVALVAGASAFAIMWGTGALIGSAVGGWSMEAFGPHGLPIVLVLVFVLYLVGAAVRGAPAPKSEPGR